VLISLFALFSLVSGAPQFSCAPQFSSNSASARAGGALLSLVLSLILTVLARVQAANGERVKFLAAGL
jgi:hypothetical protein